MGRRKINTKETKIGRGKPHKKQRMETKNREWDRIELKIEEDQRICKILGNAHLGKEEEKECSECLENVPASKSYECYQCGSVKCYDCLVKDDCGDIMDWGRISKGKTLCMDCLVDNSQRLYRIERLIENGEEEENVTDFVKEWTKQREKEREGKK